MNGQQGVEIVSSDRDFDCILMDIQCVFFVHD
jgi:CheY-like chemotaxis protein